MLYHRNLDNPLIPPKLLMNANTALNLLLQWTVNSTVRNLWRTANSLQWLGLVRNKYIACRGSDTDTRADVIAIADIGEALGISCVGVARIVTSEGVKGLKHYTSNSAFWLVLFDYPYNFLIKILSMKIT